MIVPSFVLRLTHQERDMKTILISITVNSLFTAMAWAQPPRYTVTDLGPVGPTGQPFDVTNGGLISGVAATRPDGARTRRSTWTARRHKNFSANRSSGRTAKFINGRHSAIPTA